MITEYDIARLRELDQDCREFGETMALVQRVKNLEAALSAAISVLDRPRIEMKDMDLCGMTIAPVMDAHYGLTNFLNQIRPFRQGLEQTLNEWMKRAYRDAKTEIYRRAET